METKEVVRMVLKKELPSVKYMLRRINEYAEKHSADFGISKTYLKIDYIINAALYGVTCNDYFLYQFYFLNHLRKKDFVSELFQVRFEKKHTGAESSGIIDDKERSLNHFYRYISRDWCGVHLKNSEEDYLSFFQHHARGVLKPLDGIGGTGVEIIDLRSTFQSHMQLRDYCLNNNLLLEEVILQHDILNKVYPNAINTIRMLTLQGRCIGASLRMGVGEANVDNAHAGGIFAEVEISTGTVIGRAMNYLYDCFTIHPTTGMTIPGTVIPYWENCISMVEEASALVSDVSLIGWDVAVTPTGPVMVEVNTGPGLELVQAPNGNGLRREFDKVR